MPSKKNRRFSAISCSVILTLLYNITFSQNNKPQIFVPKERINFEAATKSIMFQSEPFGFRKPSNLDKDWRVSLTGLISKNESHKDSLLHAIKKQKELLKFDSNSNQKKSNSVETSASTTTPVLGTNFEGIDNGGGNSPLDNTIAISNNGIIVTCVNSRIEYDNINGSYLGGQTFVNLINNPALSTNLCDPKVIYDSGADRFIVFVQTCDGVAATSSIVVGFSKTNNPTDGWWFYRFTGNPLNDNSWFDYPKIAVSNNELYITGNLFGSNGGPFNQSVLYQIQKNNAFNGASISWQTWSNFSGSPFTLLPVSNGIQGNYGPGIYLVASKAVTTGNSNIDFYELTDDLTATNETINHYNVTTTPYSTAGNAQQLGSSITLKTGDCRTMAGFYLNGVIHFVFHSDIGNGYNGLNYNRLNVSNATNISSTFGASGVFDYCYPAIASIGTNPNDKRVLISFSRSGPTIYPEVRAVICDDQMNWSNSILVKAGQSYVDYSWSTDSDERWGDYSGCARKFNSNPPSIWVSGDYGNASSYWGQWIGEISSISTVDIAELRDFKAIKTSVFPNPIIESYKVEFDLPNKDLITIEILDLQGKIVKELFNGISYAGKNIFSFNKAQLNSGTYFIHITSNNKIFKNEKIIILEK